MSRHDDRSGADRPRAIAEALAEMLRAHGLDASLARVAVLERWAKLVGPQIAGVTEARLLDTDGTLVVAVRTHGWMQELSLMERSLVARINGTEGPGEVRRIRWELMR
jgi:predicted nucleic acid-binding Zn ribbon protein